MATHQEIAQISDKELVERMLRTHDGRFDETFWDFFSAKVGSLLPAQPTIADVGCGPGLFLRDLRERYAVLHVLPEPLRVLAEVERVLKPGLEVLVHEELSSPHVRTFVCQWH